MLRSAGRAQRRGGLAAAAAFLQRATELTPDPAVRAERALMAAQAKLDAGDPAAASELLVAAELAPLDAQQAARLIRLKARIAFLRRRGSDASPLFLAAAGRLAPLDPVLARETYLEALSAEISAGRLGVGLGVREIAEAAAAGPPAPQPPRTADLLLDGLVTRFTEGYAAAAAPLSEAVRAAAETGEGRWMWQACRLAQDVWDDELWYQLATSGLRAARESGALSRLPIAATYRAALHVHAGEFAAATELIDESLSITQLAGTASFKYAIADARGVAG